MPHARATGQWFSVRKYCSWLGSMVLVALGRQLVQSFRASGVRSMGSTAGGRGITYGGVTIEPPSTAHVIAAEVMGGLLWSWLLIRCYEDGERFFFHTQHLDHELEKLQHGDEGDAHE